MANAQTEVRLIEFVINEEETTCNLFYTSSEPANPFGVVDGKTNPLQRV